MALIQFADLEDALALELESRLVEEGREVDVSVTIPKTRPSEFVVVRRLGGPRKNLVVESALMTFECWAATGSTAFSLCALTRAIVDSLQGETISDIRIYRISEAAGPHILPDPESNQMRYVFTASIDARAIS